jgi:transmembrane protein 231
MKRIIVHQEPLKKNYSASRLSLSYLFVIACNIFALLIPYYFWNGPEGGFLMTQGYYREQPEVSFLYKVIMVLHTTTLDGSRKEIFVSSIDPVNELRYDTFRMAKIQSNEEDTDLDGKMDWFELEVDVPLNDNEQIKSMQAIAFFNVELSTRVKLEMESVASVSVDSNLPLSGYDTVGNLMFRQSNPLGVRGYKSTLYIDETPLVRTDSEVYRTSNSNIGDVLSRYRTREVAADYVERYPIKRMDLGSASDRRFYLKMKIGVPEQEIVYIPTLMEVLKDAWVKYLSVFILCWLLLDRLKSFAFAHHLL